MPPIRLTLIAHGATAAVRTARFPLDEPLDAAGLRAAEAAARPRRVDAAWTAPAQRTRQTARALGLDAAIDPMLRDLDHGCWGGRTFGAVAAEDPAGLATWLSDPEAAPHGGETVAALLLRVETWLDGLAEGAPRVVAVTHPAVARAAVVAALKAPPLAFWRVEVGPLGRAVLRGGPGRWTLVGVS